MAHLPVDLAQELSSIGERWSPKVVARLNDYEIKLVRLEGEFVWHTHENTDELFLVLDGHLTIQRRDGDVLLRSGQLYVVPRGVEHCPITDGEVQAMLIEPSGTVNTGDAGGVAHGRVPRLARLTTRPQSRGDRTQNSLPSGSASTTQETSSP